MTGAPDFGRTIRWQQWLRRAGRPIPLRTGSLIPSDGSALTELEPTVFADLERYVESLGGQRIDLVICLDCTASMYGEIVAAQRGVDDLMLLLGDISHQFRVGIVGYRDRRNEFETRGWDLNSNLPVVRKRLWSLTADEGGNRPESVSKALRLAYDEMSWHPDAKRLLVLVGDAPPHVGTGTNCVNAAARAARAGIVTHTMRTEDDLVEHFEEIAAAGTGHAVHLEHDAALMAEIAGLTFGDRFGGPFRAFFDRYFELCR